MPQLADERWLWPAYRGLDQRLRCLVDLIRKARGLKESLNAEPKRFGRHVLNVIETVIAAVYPARGDPTPAERLRARHAPLLISLLDACRPLAADAVHQKTRAPARELLNDWDTFWVGSTIPSCR